MTEVRQPSEGKHSRLLLLGLAAWTLLNFLQAAFTELFHDEAYFWVFSRQLGIVYFDQMPAVAFLIRAGGTLFEGELGVRFFTVLISTASLLGLYKLAGVKDPRWFFGLAFGMIILHFGGFFTAPDTPQALAIVLFLFAYRGFLTNPGLAQGALMGLAAATVGYSKYQGILFVLILALLQWRRMARPGYWLAVLIAGAALIPIYLTDPETVQQTLRFHLSERGSLGWSLEMTGNFLLSQLIVMGPFMAPILIWAVIRHKPADEFGRSLKKVIYIYFGILVFLSLRNRVEANWMAPLYGPMLILAVQYYSQRLSNWKWLRWVTVASLLVIVPGRIFLVWDFLPSSLSGQMRPEYHGWDTWAQQVHDLTGDEPVIFLNSYSTPSKYWFYSGNPAGSINNHRYRRTQLSRMDFEERWQGQPVWLVAGWDHTKWSDTLPAPDGSLTYIKRIECFYSNPGVEIIPQLPAQGLIAGEEYLLPIRIESPGQITDTLQSPSGKIVQVGYSWFDRKKIIYDGKDRTDLCRVDIRTPLEMEIPLWVPERPGKYGLVLYLYTDEYPFHNSSGRLEVTVVPR